jgi:hypothetical protein
MKRRAGQRRATYKGVPRLETLALDEFRLAAWATLTKQESSIGRTARQADLARATVSGFGAEAWKHEANFGGLEP